MPSAGFCDNRQAAIQRAMGNLPTSLPAPPSFQTTNPNTQPVIYISLATNTLTRGDLYDYANNIAFFRRGEEKGAALS